MYVSSSLVLFVVSSRTDVREQVRSECIHVKGTSVRIAVGTLSNGKMVLIYNLCMTVLSILLAKHLYYLCSGNHTFLRLAKPGLSCQTMGGGGGATRDPVHNHSTLVPCIM